MKSVQIQREAISKIAFEPKIAGYESEKPITGGGVTVVTLTSVLGFAARKVRVSAGMEFWNGFSSNLRVGK